MPDYLFTIVSGTGSLLSVLTAYVNYKSPKNPPSAMIFAGWVFMGNFLSFLDSIIWAGSNPEEWWDGQIYCDISSRIKSEFSIGIPGASIGLCRFLAETTLQLSQEVNRGFFDIFFGLILPLLNSALKFTVSPTRYMISGVNGCTGVTDDSWPGIPLYYLWNPVLSIVAAIYAGICCRPISLT
jgi:pheromone a factor receptor